MKLFHQGGLHNHGNNDTYMFRSYWDKKSFKFTNLWFLWLGILCWLKRAHHIQIMFLNRIDNLRNQNNSIILFFIFLIRIDTVQKPGNALITQFSDIIDQIKSQPSAQRSTQNRNVGYTYFYSPNLNEINDIIINKWNESGFRPPLCTYRLSWARITSWEWWDDWDDAVLQTQDSKFGPWRSEAEHATSRSRRLPTILTFTRGWGRNIFCFFQTAESGNRTPNSGVKGSGANHYPRAPALIINNYDNI